MIFPIQDGITDFSTTDKSVPFPDEQILRQHIFGVMADLCNPDNYDKELLSEEYRLQIASFYTKLMLVWTD